MSQQLLPGHRFGVHEIGPQRNAHFLKASFEHLPNGGLAATRGPDQHDAHPLLGGLVKLQDLGHLGLIVAQLHLLDNHLDSPLDLLVNYILGFDAGEDILQQELEFPHIGEGQFREGVDSDGFDEQLALCLEIDVSLYAGSLLED